MSETTEASDEPTTPEAADGPRDHDAVMADARPLSNAELKEVDARLKTMLGVDIHLRAIKNRTLKLQAQYLATLAVGFDIDVELLQKTIECCVAKPTPTLHQAYDAATKSLGIARRNADIKDLSNRLGNPDLDQRVRKKYTERREQYTCQPVRPITSPALEQLLAKICGDETQLPIYPVDDPYAKERRMFEAKCRELSLALPSPDNLHAMWLGQYEAVRREFQDEHTRCTPISTEEIRKWFKGKRHNYADGVQFWRDYALLCGYVDDAGKPLPFDKRFHVDHIMERRLDRKKEDKGNIGSYAMDHYTNYAIVHKGINGWFNECFGAHETISDVKQWMHGALVCNTISNLVRTRAQQSDQLARAAWNSAQRSKFLHATLDPGARHVVPCGTRTIGARMRKRTEKAMAAGGEDDGNAADAPGGTPEVAPEDASSADTGDTTEEDEPEEQAAAAPAPAAADDDDDDDDDDDEQVAAAPAPAPAAADDDDDDDDDDEVQAAAAAAPVKVPGNQKGAILKPDGSVPVAGEEWAEKADGSLGKFVKGKVTDGSTQFRVCVSGQACKAKYGRINVMNVTSGVSNATCQLCAVATGKRLSRGLCSAAALLSDVKHTASGNYYTGEYRKDGKGPVLFTWKCRCCKKGCADAIAKAVYQHEHEGVDYPEGFTPPPENDGPAGKRKRAA